MQLNKPISRNESEAYSTECRGYNPFLFTGIWFMFYCVIAILVTANSTAFSQKVSAPGSNNLVIRGTVFSADGKPVGDAKVLLKREGVNSSEEQITGGSGQFTFAALHSGTYLIFAGKPGTLSDTVTLQLTASQAEAKIDLILNQTQSSTKIPEDSLGAMQFADQPKFTVAGVTDFTAAGGHGSDSVLRTSEALAIETSNLKSDRSGDDIRSRIISSDEEERLKTAVVKSPDSFDANHQLGELYFQSGKYSEAIAPLQSAYRIDRKNRENEYDLALACKAIGDPAHSKKYVQELLSYQESGDLYRLAAELDESLGDSLAAVREFQKAASLDPSEENFFAWGSELLLHRAIWQAQQVFEQGAKQYPSSSRMLTGLGMALFSGAAYEEAATKLCKASDLKPADPEPYIFLGKVQMAAPNRLGCIEDRLQRFVRKQPGSAEANYFYGMALQKQQDYLTNPEIRKRSEALLRAAVAIDPKYSEAYLQLGILYASQKDFAQAIDFYTKAIAADSRMSDAYYRLAIAYDRTGQTARAREEFAQHDAIAKQQAEETERQRQEIKQFLVVLPPETRKTQAP